MAIDHTRIEEFLRETPTRPLIANLCRHAGFEIVWVTAYRRELWGLHLKPNKHLRELLDTAREVLVWVAEYSDFQARAVIQAQEIIQKNRPRLCEDFCIIFSGDQDSQRHVEEASQLLQTHFVGFSTSGLSNFKPLGNRNFVLELQSRFYSKDLYYLSTAITTNSAFFGRESLVSEILGSIRSGSSHIGVFGLRKMGKTSLLYRLIDHIKSSSDSLFAHIDIQRIDAINPTLNYLLWSIGEQIIDANPKLKSNKEFRLFSKFGMFSEIPNEKLVVEGFDHDLRFILSRQREKIVLFLDEIELLSPNANGSKWTDTFIRFWRLLRGLSQQFPSRLCFFITGTNPECIELNRLNGIENPVYNFFTKIYLKPLSATESSELLTKLGTRMGLSWDEESKSHLHSLVGGHPFLLRAFASKIHRKLLPRDGSCVVTRKNIENAVEEILIEMNSTFSQMIEVFEDQYQDEFAMLSYLANGHLSEFNELSNAFPNDVAHLIGFGLISIENQISSLSIELLQTWIQRRSRAKERTRDRIQSESYSRGDDVEGYQIEALVSDRGGFGKVYKAFKPGRGESVNVALKVLRSGSFEKLQREVDALDTLQHPNIVKIVDHGKTIRGELYLAMEFLDGPTLLSHCSRAKRLSPETLIIYTKILLSALQKVHPDEDRVDAMRRRGDSLTMFELHELELARHGFVHRDIKPENIVLVEGRGPVLVDFGIATRVAEPVRTVSATPGYLPPDGVLGGLWTVDVDLFQLGVTMLQAGTGYEYNGENLNDLRNACKEDLPVRISRLLLSLTEPYRDNRPSTAANALRILS